MEANFSCHHLDITNTVHYTTEPFFRWVPEYVECIFDNFFVFLLVFKLQFINSYI